MSRLMVFLFAAALLGLGTSTALASVHDAYRDGVREVRQAKINGAKEVAAERREAAKDYFEADNAWERGKAISEGRREVRAAQRKAEREVRSERREARREIRREQRRWD